MQKQEIIGSIPLISNTESGMFFLLAGPCVVESEDIVMRVAEKLTRITERLKIPYVFKASYRKANRSRHDSFTGIGDMKALGILSKVRSEFNIPVPICWKRPEKRVNPSISRRGSFWLRKPCSSLRTKFGTWETNVFY